MKRARTGQEGDDAPARKPARVGLLMLLGPGIVVAATGIGAGDLATATFTGSHLGTAVLWAVALGALFKLVVNEGLARWQLATGQTFLEGMVAKLGPVAAWLFLPYLLLWTFFVGSAMMSACGVTVHAIVHALWPAIDDPAQGKLIFGVACSLAGLGLVLAGGYGLFEKVMGICVALMFTIVLVTALLLWPGTDAVLRGLLVPSIPDMGGRGMTWTMALIGGVGGTLTVLCYGYWIRERGRQGVEYLRTCRIDLGVAYAMTAFFGMAMVIIGSTMSIEGKGAGLVVALADRLEGPLGPAGKWAFLIGAFSAVFSSLLGVWQSVPYLFADIYYMALARGTAVPADLRRTRPYRVYLLLIALVPMLGLTVGFAQIQKLYAVIGAMFLPALAAMLLYLNGRAAWVGRLRNGAATTAVLIATLLFFGWVAIRSWLGG